MSGLENTAVRPIDFDSEFQRAHRALWVVAAAIVLNRADADDVVQEAALIAVRKLDTFQPGTNFRAWMAQIVRNVAMNHRRGALKQSRRLAASPDPHATHPAPSPRPDQSPVDTLGGLKREQNALSDSMVRALRDLDPTARACILLRCIEGLNYAEISGLLAIPEGTAMSHVFRARAALAAALGGKEGAIS